MGKLPSRTTTPFDMFILVNILQRLLRALRGSISKRLGQYKLVTLIKVWLP